MIESIWNIISEICVASNLRIFISIRQSHSFTSYTVEGFCVVGFIKKKKPVKVTVAVISLGNKNLASFIFLRALKFALVIINDASDKKSSVQLTKEGYTQNVNTWPNLEVRSSGKLWSLTSAAAGLKYRMSGFPPGHSAFLPFLMRWLFHIS